jgi:hypothetical protein
MSLNYDGRRFTPSEHVADGRGPVALYRQDGDLLWAEVSGGELRRGALTGICAPDGTLDFAYCMVYRSGEIVSGRCSSTPTVLADGRIRLDEVWERYGADGSRGVSSIEEVPSAGVPPERSSEPEER